MGIFFLVLLSIFLLSLVISFTVKTFQPQVKPISLVQNGAFEKLAQTRLVSPDKLLHETRSFLEENAVDENLIPNLPDSRHMGDPCSNKAMWAAAMADAATPGVNVWLRWNSVDEHVFQAFEHLSHQQIDGVADLMHVVDAKQYAISTEGFSRKLLGHLGEWHVQEHLAQAGHAVAMPTSTNEAGLDMWVDGHPVNVKTVKDAASAASAHFQEYPDISIIVPSDAANIPVDAVHFDPSVGIDPQVLGESHLVLVDDALSHADLVDQTENALDVVDNPGAEFGFPIITFCVSGLREGRLLVQGNTDLGRVAKNVLVDTAAVGGGGFAGGKIGAAIGTAIVPGFGTVIGGLLGALGGALAGRAIGNEIKRAPLEKAKNEYETAIQAYNQRESELLRVAEGDWEIAKTKETKILNSLKEKLEAEHLHKLGLLREIIRKRVQLDKAEAEALLFERFRFISNLVEEDRKKLEKKVPNWAALWAGMIAPAEAKAYSQHKAEVASWEERYRSLMFQWRASPQNTAMCFDLIMATPGGLQITEYYLKEVESVRRKAIFDASQSHLAAIQKMMQARNEAKSRLRQRMEVIRNEIESKISPYVLSLKFTTEEYKCELRKAGVQV